MGVSRLDPDKVIWNEVEGKVVVLQMSSGAYFTFNSVGSDIWRLLEKGSSNAEIVATLGKQYDVSGERLQADVEEFVAQLIKKGLA